MADRVTPRLGMEKALEELLELLPADHIELVLISGPAPDSATYPVTALCQPGGWRGRVLALVKLRKVARSRSQAGAVIVAVGAWAFVALAAATVVSGIRLILWEHSILPWRIRNEWRVTFAAIALRVLAFRLQSVVCVSNSNRASVAPFVWPLKQLVVIPNISAIATGGYVMEGRDTEPRCPVRLVGVGSLNRRKNWELAVRAMLHLPAHFTLELAGAGEQQARLSTLIDDLGLKDRVRLLGYVSGAERLMAAADIIVHPSLAETFGYTMIEAAEICRPVVVLDLPAMNEMVPRYACGECAEATPTGFADAIMRAQASTYDYAQTSRARSDALSSNSILISWNALLSGLKQ